MASPDGPRMEPSHLRVAPPGTRMTWRRLDGHGTESGVIGALDSDLLAHYVWEGRPCSMYFFGIRCAGDEVRFDRDAYLSIFPLEVGKAVSFRRSVEQWEWINTINVISTETLDLRFGAVDTFLVACETQGQNNPFHVRNDIWYAPCVGWNVQFRYRDSRGESYSWQAVEFVPPH